MGQPPLRLGRWAPPQRLTLTGQGGQVLGDKAAIPRRRRWSVRSGVVAPEMTDDTGCCASSQPNASSSRVCPCSRANGSSASSRSIVGSVRTAVAAVGASARDARSGRRVDAAAGTCRRASRSRAGSTGGRPPQSCGLGHALLGSAARARTVLVLHAREPHPVRDRWRSAVGLAQLGSAEVAATDLAHLALADPRAPPASRRSACSSPGSAAGRGRCDRWRVAAGESRPMPARSPTVAPLLRPRSSFQPPNFVASTSRRVGPSARGPGSPRSGCRRSCRPCPAA